MGGDSPARRTAADSNGLPTKTYKPIASVAALPERHWQLQILKQFRRGSRMRPIVLHRAGDYHGGSAADAPSASFLRGQADWAGYMPEAARAVQAAAPRYRLAAGERAVLARLRAMGEDEFAALPYGSEGLWQKVMHACRTEASLEGILAAAKSKRYPRTRLMRMLLCGFLGLTEQQLTEPRALCARAGVRCGRPGHPAGGAGRALAPACGRARTGLRICGNGAALPRALWPVPGERARGACTEIARLCAKGLTSCSISHTIISRCARRTEKEREKWQLCFGSNARPAAKS